MGRLLTCTICLPRDLTSHRIGMHAATIGGMVHGHTRWKRREAGGGRMVAVQAVSALGIYRFVKK